MKCPKCRSDIGYTPFGDDTKGRCRSCYEIFSLRGMWKVEAEHYRAAWEELVAYLFQSPYTVPATMKKVEDIAERNCIDEKVVRAVE